MYFLIPIIMGILAGILFLRNFEKYEQFIPIFEIKNY